VAKFRNGGQTCVCPNRIYVQARVYAAFADLLARRVASLKVGPATDPGAQIGPMINARAIDKIAHHVDDAVRRGASVLVGGKRLSELGPNFYAPTVLTDANDDMLFGCEETFGPIAPLFRFDDETEAVRLANATPYGLAAYFYTQDVRRIDRVAGQLEAGVIGVNEGAVSSEAAPFGGVKESGYGREGSKYGLDDYLAIKYVCQGGLN
jgi:succinate-semialdehyde dehydrogenase/glutarate-semialdehyde dehydrogenase